LREPRNGLFLGPHKQLNPCRLTRQIDAESGGRPVRPWGDARGWDELLSSTRVRPKSDILAAPDEHALIPTNSFSRLASAGLNPVEVEG
jgi:hypothetical protein